jgi:hypothetical protein
MMLMDPQKKTFEDPKAKTQEYLEQHKLGELMEVRSVQNSSSFCSTTCKACKCLYPHLLFDLRLGVEGVLCCYICGSGPHFSAHSSCNHISNPALLQGLLAELMYNKPANPKQYIVMQLEKIKVAGTKPLLNKQDLDTSECCRTTAHCAIYVLLMLSIWSSSIYSML